MVSRGVVKSYGFSLERFRSCKAAMVKKAYAVFVYWEQAVLSGSHFMTLIILLKNEFLRRLKTNET